MKKILVAFLWLVLTQSCRYKPFLKYYFPSKKTHVARFTKWEKMLGSNSNPLRSCYHVNYYDWLVHVHPTQKNMTALMKIDFSMQSNQDSILLDMQGHLKMDGIKSSFR